jgi:uncharacterized membrane-anchored protein
MLVAGSFGPFPEGLVMLRIGRPMFALCVAILAVVAGAEEAETKERPVAWTRGPATVDVGGRLAQAKLEEGIIFTGKEDTQRLLRKMGNRPDGTELGLVTSSVDGENWFIVFEWRDVGFVKDDDKNEIDADAILKSIKEGTEEANQERKKEGRSALHVVGWADPPHYDSTSHNLTWAIRARGDDGREVINHNVRVLGRLGVMSITLVDGPEGLATAKPRVDQLIQGFSYKRGKTYSEWVPGDKVAAYGLTALVAAGAGAAAVKTGLLAGLIKILAKAGKAIVLAIAALGAGLVRFFKGGGDKKGAAPGPPYAS